MAIDCITLCRPAVRVGGWGGQWEALSLRPVAGPALAGSPFVWGRRRPLQH